jgi:2-polyprenyl-3-methyl-5-hydroxy-6-metoxy-1,4-benzoquinol methylase
VEDRVLETSDGSQDVYDVMLKFQADMVREQEEAMLRHAVWNLVSRILDFGCGNGYFSSVLAQLHPDKHIIGYDIDRRFIHRATHRYEHAANLRFSDLEESLISFNPNAIICRLCLHHVANPFVLLESLLTRFENTRVLYLVNPADHLFALVPNLESFHRDLEELRKPHQERRGLHYQEELHAIIERFGFVQVATANFVADSKNAQRKNLMFGYMSLTAAQAFDGKLNLDTSRQLVQWLFNDSSLAQFGMIGNVYEKR